jgi:hypothetical protein
MKDVPLGDVNDDHFVLQNFGFEITLRHDRLTYSNRKSSVTGASGRRPFP